MDPATLALLIGAPLLSSGINWFSNQGAQQDAKAQRGQIAELFNKIQAPNFDPSQLTPEEYKLVGQLNPEIAQYIAPKAPELLRGQGADTLTGQDAQRQVLSEYMNMARNGNDPVLNAQRNQNLRDAGSAASSARASLDQSMARRGFAPSSALQYGAAMQSGQDAALRAALAGEQNVQESAGRRMNALSGAAGLGGQLYNQGMDMEAKNAASTNEFNRTLANQMNDYNKYVSGIRNDAAAKNLGAAQSVADRNVTSGNDAALQRQQRGDKIAQANFDNPMSIAKAQAGVGEQKIGDIWSGAKSQAQTVQGLSDAAQSAGAIYGSYGAPKKKKNIYGQEVV